MTSTPDEKTVLKRARTSARGKFTHAANVLKDSLDNEAPIPVLQSLLNKVDSTYDKLESAHDNYLALLDDNDPEIQEANTHLEDSGKT